MAMRTTGWLQWALSAGLVAVLVWPALYNGQPIFFPDTTAYIRGADAGMQAAFGRRTAWSLSGEDAIVKPLASPAPSAGTAAAPALPATGPVASPPPSLSSIKDKTILSGRSPYYGALLYLGDLTGGFWLSIAVQALAMVAALWFTLWILGLGTRPAVLAAVGGAALLSPLPFFVSFLMPDVFASIGILMAASLLAVYGPLTWPAYLAAFVLLSAAVVVHDTHVLIVGALLALAGGSNLIARRWLNWRGMVVIGLAIATALVAQAMFSTVVRRVVGAPPLRPPFLMARMIEDGPGYRYLRTTCPANGLVACQFLERLPHPAYVFLWERGPDGVFANAQPEQRRQLSAEEMRFVLAVLAYDPWGELLASLKSVGTLLTTLRLDEFQYHPEYKEGFAVKIPPEHFQRMQGTAAYRGTMPVRAFATLSLVALLIGATTLAAVLAWGRTRTSLEPAVARLTAWIVAGTLVNAAICGVLSGVYPRLGVRTVWLIPFAAVLVVIALLMPPKRSAPGPR
jgi:hypothetical protein